MPRFSKKSLSKLKMVCPDLRILFKTVIIARDCSILCGARIKAEQDWLFNMGRSKVMWPNSKHNLTKIRKLAEAVDVAPYFANNNPHIIWPNIKKSKIDYAKEIGLYYSFAGYVFAIADTLGIKIRWGGDWDGDGIHTDQKFDDLIHFEILELRDPNTIWIG